MKINDGFFRLGIWVLVTKLALVTTLVLPGLGLADEDEVVTRGELTAKTAETITVEAVVYRFTAATEFKGENDEELSVNDFVVGDFVKAEGHFEGGSLVADEVELEGDDDGGGDDDDDGEGGGDDENLFEVEGLITALSENSIVVQNHTFAVNDNTEIEDEEENEISLADIEIGDRVEVKAQESAPEIAVKIELTGAEGDHDDDDDDDDNDDDGDDFDTPDSDTEAVGVLEVRGEGSITVSGVQYVILSTTRIEFEEHGKATLADIPLGSLVKIEFYLDGENRVARKIELEDEDGDDLEVRGPIAALVGDEITVRGVTAVITEKTRFKKSHGETASREDLHVNLIVKLKAGLLEDGRIVARTIKIREENPALDFDDNQTLEKVIYRKDLGMWLINYRVDNNGDGLNDYDVVQWGLPTDEPVPGDYDGDGRGDIAVYRSASGTWFIRLSSSGYGNVRTIQWGLPGDKPCSGDYDGDGIEDPAVYRSSVGMWFVFLSGGGSRRLALSGNSGHLLVRQWGLSNHTPHCVDRDGDGRADLVAIDESSGTWYTLYSSGGYNRTGALQGDLSAGDAIQFGLVGDKFLTGDFDGDGKDDLSVFRNGIWYVRFSSGAPTVAVSWGLPGDIPGIVEAGEDSLDNRSSLTVYRRSDGNHYDRSPAGTPTITQWGLPGVNDDPVGEFDLD